MEGGIKDDYSVTIPLLLNKENRTKAEEQTTATTTTGTSSVFNTCFNGLNALSGDIFAEVVDHFKQRFTEDDVDRPLLFNSRFKRLSAEQAASLVTPFSAEEVKSAVWECGGDKAPGPDGFNFNFIKKFWALLEHDVLDVINFYYNGGRISHGCNASFIALIPKISDPLHIKEFRPISLVGCVYKIFGKALAIRLKKVLPGIVGIEQTAFIQGRNILDGPLILNETIAWLKKAGKKCLLFKIDFEKAYDMVSWRFLDHLMEQMGFPARWRGWIENCLMSASVSVLVNGAPSKEFKMSRGLRQGDPLSPFLFTLVMDGLGVAIKSAIDIGILHGVRLPNNGPVLSHLFFADDAIIMGDWSLHNARNLSRILKCFQLSAGLKINFNKSNLVGVGVCEQELNRGASVLNCQVGKLPFSHLGVPVGANMSRVSNWNPVVQNFKNRLTGWKAKALTWAGRLTLCKSVLGSIPMYFLSIFKAPAQIINVLEGLRRKFLWGGSEEESKINWVKWDKVLAPKELGGLGVGSLADANKALLAKWRWLFLSNKGDLWVRVISAIHVQRRKQKPIPLNIAIRGIWKNIVSSNDDLAEENIDLNNLIRVNVGDGSMIRFWKDKWVGNDPLMVRFPSLFALERDKDCMLAERWEKRDHITHWKWDWKRALGTGHDSAEFYNLICLLHNVQVGDSLDRWEWLADESGVFTVKSLRKILESNRAVVDLNPILWSDWIPLNIRCFVWRACMNRIASKEALLRRGVLQGSGECSKCFGHIESANHILLGCSFAGKVWEKVSEWVGVVLNNGESVRDIMDRVAGSGRPKDKLLKLNAIAMGVIWCLWRARNNLVFEGRCLSVSKVVENVKVSTYFWLLHRSKLSNLMWHVWCNDPI